jgi:hypothetical protein
MTRESLVRLSLRHGRYLGELDAPPGTEIEAVHEGRVVATADLGPEGDGPVRVSIAVPSSVLSDGVQVVALRSTATGAILDRITIFAGEAAEEDLVAEIALLRAELEMLKRAFREHVAGDRPD